MIIMIGKKLREHRKAQGLSQAQLGAELGLSASSVAMWETDKRDPDIQTLLELSNFFGVDFNCFLNADDTPNIVVIKNISQQIEEETKKASDLDIQMALFGEKVNDEMYQELKEFAVYLKLKNKFEKLDK